MSQVNQAFEPDAAADPKEVEMSAEGAEKEAKTPIVKKPIQYANHPFPGFKPYPERGCTDALCIIVFLFAFVGWMVLLGFSVTKGKPEIITHSTDYKGNVCGVYLGKNKKGTENSWKEGTAPHVDIKKAKKGVFPRMVDDFVRLIPTDATDLPSVSDISITTFCAEECPKKGSIFCTYKYSKEQAEKKGWESSPLKLNSAAEIKAKKYLLITATLSRDTVAKDITLLNNACAGTGWTEKDKTDCKNIFYNCDITVVDTTSIMGRCVPSVTPDDDMEEERCINPLKSDNCTLLPTDKDYWQSCVKDSNGIMKKVKYPCKWEGGEKKKCLVQTDRKRCKEIEDKKEVTSVEIPQAAMTTKILKNLQSFSKYVQDVKTAAGPVALCGMGFSVVVGLLFLVVVGRIAGCFVWFSILLTFVALVTLAFLALIRGGIIAGDVVPGSVAEITPVGLETSNEYVDYYKVAGIVFSILSLLFFVTILFLRKKIVEAIKIIKISANAVVDNFKIVFWPIISFTFIGAFTVLFILIGCLLMASVDSEDYDPAKALNQTNVDMMDEAFLTVTQYTGDDTLKYFAIYDLVMWLWVCELVQAIGIFVIGGTVTHWYFTPKGTKQESLGNTSRCARCQEGGMSGALCVAMKRHFGTAVFGSAIIAIIQTIRIAVAYMLKQMKGGPDNRLVKCMKGCVSCCLGCFEKCAKYLSKNAYIYTSIHGSSFCYSSYKSFLTIFNNLLRFGATGLSSGLIMLFGKVFVTFASTVACYLWLSRSADYSRFESENYIDAKGTVFVCAVVAVMAFIVAEVFFGVYEITSDSIMLSYCLDIDNGGAAFKDKLGEEYELKKAPEDEHEDEINHEEDKKFCCGPCACK
jgi:hypothetical protein